jgi:hypothetical protein
MLGFSFLFLDVDADAALLTEVALCRAQLLRCVGTATPGVWEMLEVEGVNDEGAEETV